MTGEERKEMGSNDPPQQIIVIQQGNGLATASLVLGIVGALAGLIPLLFWIALPLGLVGLGLGIPAMSRPRERGGRGMAIAGAILSVIAIALAILGIVIISDALS